MPTTIACLLPEKTTHVSLLLRMEQMDALNGTWERLILTAPENCFVAASGLAYLAAWGLTRTAEGRSIEIYGNEDVRRYLSRMDLFDLLGIPYEESFRRHDERGRFLPVHTVTDSDSVFDTTNAICDLVLQQFENARDFLPAMEWCVNEVIDNVRMHAEATSPGAVCAQFYPKQHRLDVAIVDQGRGIKRALEESRALSDHRDAITTALMRGVTRNPEVGQGNGLAGTHDIVALNGGELQIWTGDQNYRLVDAHPEAFSEIPICAGTGVSIRLDTSRETRLEDTFIANADWTFIDQELMRMESTGGFRIRSECLHTGGRETAAPFRRKLESLVPDASEPIVLDFDGVSSPSSSFLDELLGRLADKLGEDTFRRKINIVNMTDRIRRMSDVVIGQRLGRNIDT